MSFNIGGQQERLHQHQFLSHQKCSAPVMYLHPSLNAAPSPYISQTQQQLHQQQFQQQQLHQQHPQNQQQFQLQRQQKRRQQRQQQRQQKKQQGEEDYQFSLGALEDGTLEDVLIGEGPHKSELCEACAKGKCSLGNGDDSQTTGVRQSVRSGERRFVQIPLFESRPDDMLNEKLKVRWQLKFDQL